MSGFDMFASLIGLLTGMNLELCFQTPRYFSVFCLKWHFLSPVVTYSDVCCAFPAVPVGLHFLWRHFPLSPKHTIYWFTLWGVFFPQSFFLWNNFCFRSQEHLRYKVGWSQNPGYFLSFLLLYYPQSAIEHTTFLYSPFPLIDFQIWLVQ